MLLNYNSIQTDKKKTKTKRRQVIQLTAVEKKEEKIMFPPIKNEFK